MCQIKGQITNEMFTVSSPADMSVRTHKTLSYRCEAAVLLPRHTAVAGLLLTAALLGRCFSETAANSKMTGE